MRHRAEKSPEFIDDFHFVDERLANGGGEPEDPGLFFLFMNLVEAGGEIFLADRIEGDDCIFLLFLPDEIEDFEKGPVRKFREQGAELFIVDEKLIPDRFPFEGLFFGLDLLSAPHRPVDQSDRFLLHSADPLEKSAAKVVGEVKESQRSPIRFLGRIGDHFLIFGGLHRAAEKAVEIVEILKRALARRVLQKMARVCGEKQGEDRHAERLGEIVFGQFPCDGVKILDRGMALAEDLES